MRTIWNGSISFGLVNIPVGLALATQRQDVSFRTLHRECGTPIKQKRWCPVHERDVEPDELVKGWEFAKGQYVLVEESDLEAVALTRSQSIAILRFVRLEDVDPVYFDRTYYLSPADADAQRKPYVLLLRAMEDSGMAAVGKFVLWGKENLCLIRAKAGTLLLETLFFAEDVRARDEIEEAVAETEVQEAELKLAEQVISSLAGEWTPEDFENDYRRDLAQMLEAKLAGQEIVAPEPVTEAPVIDLMEALRQSVADAQSRRSRSRLQERESRREGRLPVSQGDGEEVRLTPSAAANAGGLRRPDRLQLRLEEVFVDLAVVDRHALLDAHPDHLLPVDLELLRQFFGREVIRHRRLLLPERKNPPRATRRRVRSHPRLS